MNRSLRAFFLGCQLREKLLVVAFLGIAVLLWASGFSKRAAAFWREQHRTTVDLADQTQWITNSGAIEAAAQKAAARLDAARTLDGVRLIEAMQKLAADAGLRPNIGQPSNPPGNGQFSIHSVEFTAALREPDTDGTKNWNALKKFYTALQQRAPYISIELFTVRPDPVNKAQISVQMRVSSVEITKTH